MAFCKNCGKELKKGEKCNCEEVKETKNEETKSSNSGFDFGKTMIAIKDDLLKSIKNPIDVVKDNVNEENMPKTYIMAILYALSYGLFFCGLMKLLFPMMMGMVTSIGGGLGISSKLLKKIELPYFKIFVYGLAVGLVALIAYAVVMLLIPAIFKNKKLDFKKSLTLTSSAMIPMIFVNVICTILLFLDLDIRITLVVYLAGNTVVSYNYAYVYAKLSEIKDNLFGYVIATLVVLSGLISVLNIYITSESFGKSIATDMVKDFDLDDDF